MLQVGIQPEHRRNGISAGEHLAKREKAVRGDQKPDAPSPTRASCARRPLDLAFYRDCYEDAAGLTDAELIRRVESGELGTGRPLNPTEYLQQVLTRKLLPADFDPLGYRIANPALWRQAEDWRLVFDYLRRGRLAGAAYHRPFDPVFYRQLNSAQTGHLADTELHPHWIERNRAGYGSLDEALVRNGFHAAGWVAQFDVRRYLVTNGLVDAVRNDVQGLVHFIETGWRAMLPISAEQAFDPAFYVELTPDLASLPPAELYRCWIEVGLPAGAVPNEAAMLRSMSLDLPCHPRGFDWQAYLDARPELVVSQQERWVALNHCVEAGLLDGRPLPIAPEEAPRLLLAAADRFAVAGRLDEAERLYDQLLLQSELDAEALQHAADHALRQQRHGRALALYERVRAQGGASVWTWVNGTAAALALGDLDQADGWVIDGLRALPRNERLLALHRDIQQRRFDFALALHAGCVRRGGDGSAALDAAIGQIHHVCLAALAAQYGAPRLRPLRGDKTLRAVMLANCDLPQCTFYRVTLKAEQLCGTGVALTVIERDSADTFRSALATADLVLFYRLAASADIIGHIAACQALGIPTVYEIDDLVFDPAHFPDPLASYAGTITAAQHDELRAGVPLLRNLLRLCDAGIASTEHLAAAMRPLVRSHQVLVHRNGLSHSLAEFARTAAPSTARSTVTLFYGSGTLAHAADFHTQLEPALARLMAAHDQVRFLACGHVDVAALARRFPGRVQHVPFLAEREAYLSLLLQADIALAVLESSRFNDCKSEIKWLEAAVFCVPAVVSGVGGFREVLRDGEHVVCVEPVAEAWFQALDSLLLDPDRRARIGRAARDLALAEFAPAVLGATLGAGLTRLARQSRPAAAAPKPRVLLVNVFFPPQALGGATRVMADQARILRAEHADAYDLAVVCGNDEPAEPYRLSSYCWDGVPVWSVSTPHREHMDWIASDPLMAPLIDAVLDEVQPDLVHFHCIQRLTATAVERVARRGIPYVVTVHDAWWVSDHQFLLNPLEQLRLPGDAEEYESAANPHTRAASGARRLLLRGCLDRAAAVLAVSDCFAALYCAAGVAQAVAVPNGLPELPPLQPTAPVPGVVRLGHLGGMTYHKGLTLLRHVLQRGRFPELELLVVDHARAPGTVGHAVWGETRVRIIGKVPQDRIGWLYGQFDVLVAPSVWPESFGLVTREALAYGRWVIASDRGAIGEAVTPGGNGFIVDVRNGDALAAALAALGREPARYTAPPGLPVRLRGARDQVTEVVQVYDRVLGREPTAQAGTVVRLRQPVRAAAAAGRRQARPAACRPSMTATGDDRHG